MYMKYSVSHCTVTEMLNKYKLYMSVTININHQYCIIAAFFSLNNADTHLLK